MGIIEAVPNISEGRNKAKLDLLKEELSQLGLKLLDFDPDVDHNRTVVTAVSDKGFELLSEFSIQLISRSIELFDIRSHSGVHPRIGMVDVLPFIALNGCTKDELIGPVDDLASEISEKYRIPVYLYGHSARKDNRTILPMFRNVGYEQLKILIKKADYCPDYGPVELHERFGAIAIGVRDALIAYNINIQTENVKVARRVASKIRESAGGLKGIRALGVYLASRGMAQVSINVCEYKTTSIREVFDAVSSLLEEEGIGISESEVAGFLPKDSLVESDISRLKLRKYKVLPF